MNNNILFKPENKRAEIKQGLTILQIALKNRVHIDHKCGGKGACLTCKVKISNQDNVSSPTKSELQKLGKSLISSGTRLACQTKVLGEVEVEIPESPLKAAIHKQMEQQNKEL